MTSLPMLSPKSQPRPWVSGSSGKIWGLPLAPLQSLSWAQRGGKGAPGSLLPQLLCSGRVLGTRASTTLRPGCTPALQELRTILPAINASALTQASSAPERLGSHRGKEGHAPPPGSGAGPHPSVPAASTQTRAATRRSWLLLSACARAALAPGPAERQPHSTLSHCTRACWYYAASPALGTPRGHPHRGPSPSTLSPSACPLAAPASCPGWHDDCQPQLSPHRAMGRDHLPDWTVGISLWRGPLLFMCIY